MEVNLVEKYQINLQIILKRVEKLQNLQKLNICDGNVIKNEMLIKIKFISFFLV